MSKYVLETQRLRLRELEPGDLPALYEMLADDYARQIFERTVALPDYGDRWLQRNLRRYREVGFGLWALETKATGEFAGDCGLTYKEISGQRLLEVGYHLTLAARGKGYATEAAAACLRYAFDVVGASRVVSIVDLENPASRRVAERLHARFEVGHEYCGRPIYLYVTEGPDLEP